jgi:formate hydrogenlyase transcriptional activator
MERYASRDSDETLNQTMQSGATLKRFIDTIPTLAWCTLPDGSNESCNDRWHDYTGLSAGESAGWGWNATIHPEDLNRWTAKWQTILATREPGEIEARLRRHDGEFRWFLFRAEPSRNASGEIVRWYGINTDIETLKRAEEKLRQDEMELQQVVDTIAQLVLFLSPDGRALHANKFMLDYTGLSPEEVRAEDFRVRVFHPDDIERLDGERQQAFSLGVPFANEQRVRRNDGQYHWFFIRFAALLDQHGHPLHWYATGLDIDDRKLTEDRLRNENVVLREEVEHSSMFEEIVGSSKVLRNVLSQVSKVAPTDSTVLILGETGTGKELIARAIHNQSKRSKRAFIKVNCAAIPPSLIASELFGHEKGSFTGATQRHLGRFESADGGTIFLDEVGELPAETQVALLRVLQEREFERVGGNVTISVDVRVIAATNRDLTAAVSTGSLREDLFYRLNVFPIQIPPLRERVGDIVLLVEYLIDRYAKRSGKKIRNISTKTLELFQQYDWPGNIRELQNVIERAVILCEDETFSVDETWIKRKPAIQTKTSARLVDTIVEREKQMIEAALAECEGLISGPSGAAAKLCIPRQTLESKIRKLGINRHLFKTA